MSCYVVMRVEKKGHGRYRVPILVFRFGLQRTDQWCYDGMGESKRIVSTDSGPRWHGIDPKFPPVFVNQDGVCVCVCVWSWSQRYMCQQSPYM